MTIPKKLEEKRDELAKEWTRGWNPSADSENSVIALNYKKGFNDCANLLLPEIEKLSAALEFCLKNYLDIPCEKSKSDGILTTGRIEANRALQSWQEFLGEESEGE